MEFYIVSDITDPEVSEHIEVTENIIEDLGASDKPRIYVYNKCDCNDVTSYAVPRERVVIVSAKNNIGIDKLLATIEDVIHDGKRECELIIPYSEQSVISSIYNDCTVYSVDYRSDGVYVKALLGKKESGMLSKYIIEV